MGNERITTCFISAPAESDIRPLAEALVERDVRVLGPSDIAPGASWQSAIISNITNADLVIGVLTHRDVANTMFELGIAVGHGRPLLIFAPAKSAVLPSDLLGFQVVRTSLQNREAINFALDQVLASPSGPTRSNVYLDRFQTNQTVDASFYRERLRQILHFGHWSELESLVAQVIRDSGVEVVAEAASPDRGIDLVVWSDGLQTFVDNPFPVEIKARLRSREDAKRALSQTAKASLAIGSRWSMLLYGEGPSSNEHIWVSNPAVLALRIDDLLTRLESMSFPEIVRTLRNRRVHGLDA